MFNTICKKAGNIPIICKLSLLNANRSEINVYKCKYAVSYDGCYAELKCYFE